MQREMICIKCPRGCNLIVENIEDIKNLKVTGNQCPRGEKYAYDEITDPKRTVTATARIDSKTDRRLPVRTDGEIPKDKFKEIVDIISSLNLKGPIKRGEIIIENVDDTGVNVIATKTVG